MTERIRFGVPIRSETRAELVAIIQLSWPVVLLQMIAFLLQTITIVFSGHINSEVLAGVVFAMSLINTTGYVVGYGLLTAVDTLIPQTLGANNKPRIGVIVQRATLIISLASLPIMGLWLNSESIARLVLPDRKVAAITGRFMNIYLPSFPTVFLFTVLMKYMLNQEVVRPLLLVGFASCGLQVVANAILIYGLDWGLDGVAFGTALGNIILFLLTLCCIRWMKLHQDTWGGWSKECLQDWGQFYRLAIPGTIMSCAEFWGIEIGTFMMASLGNVPISTQGILVELDMMIYNIPFGIAIATSVRTGTYLGQGLPERARLVSRIGLHISWLLGVMFAVILIAIRNYVGYIFSSDRVVLGLTAETVWVFAPVLIADWVQVNQQGVIRGTGYQTVGAIINISSQLLVAVPVSACLVYVSKLGPVGFWVGFGVGMVIRVFGYSLVIFKLNWKRQSEVAKVRAGVVENSETMQLRNTRNNNRSYGSLNPDSFKVDIIQRVPKASASYAVNYFVVCISFLCFIVGVVCRFALPSPR